MRFLLDEMLPPSLAATLRSRGHDALDVREVGLGSHQDHEILAGAVTNGRVVVTENIGDFTRLVDERAQAGDPSGVVLLVRRGRGPGGLIAHRLARALDRWATDHPHPWAGPHWLSIDD